MSEGSRSGRELDAREIRFHVLRQALYRARLGQPGKALHQDVAVGQQGDQQVLDDGFLADDGRAHVGFQVKNGFQWTHDFSLVFCSLSVTQTKKTAEA